MSSEVFPLIRAAVGTYAELARRLGVSRATVTNWRRRGEIPPKRVLAVEAAVGGQVTRHQIRADLYPVERVAAL